MNSKSIYLQSFVRRAVLARVAMLFGLLALIPTLQGQTYYDFDNSTDAGLTKSTAHPSTITYPSDALGGHAYRLQGTPMSSGSDTNSRVFSYFTNRVFTNFYAAVDIVAWNTNQDSDMVVGLIARANGNDALTNASVFYAPIPFDPDLPNGLTFNVRLHNARSYDATNAPLGSADQMSMWSLSYNQFGGKIILGAPVVVTQARFRWVPGHSYRLVFIGTNGYAASPSYYSCSIYDVNDLTKPLLSMTGDDTYGDSNGFIPHYGYVGIMAYKYANNDLDPNVDATFDNFYVGETAPVPAVVAPAIPYGKPGAPQVINRVPVSFKNFHPAAAGISFNATTLTTTNNINTSAMKLFLNGMDVSAGLVIAGPATNASVSYAGLASNVVYNASVVVQDVLGRSTTNEWTFDTFSDGYLASSAAKVIEAEDYNFSDGQSINDPPASGYADYDFLTDSGSIINSGIGYVDQTGSNAKLGGVDFFDYDSGPHTLDNQYRHFDGVGTQQGNSVTYAFGAFINPSPLGYGVSQTYDTQRSKYSNLSPTLQEYIVERTEGGEWMNYTRNFDGSKTYNAYLRAAGGLAQPVRLDQITAAPATNILGNFNVPSTFFVNNYRYVPLLTTNGELATVNLNGANTIRLTFDSPQSEGTKFGLSLNYLVFVPVAPAVPKLYSSATANGTYLEEAAAVVNTTSKTITIPRNGAARFYRIGFTSQLTISGITISGANVVLTYQ